jgi:hypothetical protein
LRGLTLNVAEMRQIEGLTLNVAEMRQIEGLTLNVAETFDLSSALVTVTEAGCWSRIQTVASPRAPAPGSAGRRSDR